jgi:hypothetical protein
MRTVSPAKDMRTCATPLCLHAAALASGGVAFCVFVDVTWSTWLADDNLKCKVAVDRIPFPVGIRCRTGLHGRYLHTPEVPWQGAHALRLL